MQEPLWGEESRPEVEPVRSKGGVMLYKLLFEGLETLLTAIVMTVVIFWLVGRVAVVSGISMLPTMHDGDLVLVRSALYKPQAGDIVIVRRAQDPLEPLIKRVIATEGQTVDIDFARGIVYVDGERLYEAYVNTTTDVQYDLRFPQQVPEGCLFVMGDNRNNSLDSRSSDIGMVDTRNICGKVVYRIFPPDSRGAVN